MGDIPDPDDVSPEDIPAQFDYATGEKGDLGVWPPFDETEFAPAPVWDGVKAVNSYPTHSHLGEHFTEGEQIAIRFRDRTLVCTVDEVDTGDDD